MAEAQKTQAPRRNTKEGGAPRGRNNDRRGRRNDQPKSIDSARASAPLRQFIGGQDTPSLDFSSEHKPANHYKEE